MACLTIGRQNVRHAVVFDTFAQEPSEVSLLLLKSVLDAVCGP